MKRVLGRVAIALVSTFIALGMIEAALRRARPANADAAGIHRRSDDPALVYELTPGARGERDGVQIAINSAGFRDDEFAAPAPDALRIVVLGDSVAWGWGVPMEAAFPQLLETRLRERHTSSVVFNLSVDGYATPQEVRMLEARGLGLDPDVVVLNYILNDPDEADGGLAAYYRPRIELVEIAKRGLRYVAERFRDIPTEYHHRVHARFGDRIARSFRRLGEISRERRIPIVVAITPVFRFAPPYPWRDLHEAIRVQCESNGLLCLDLYPAFEHLDLNEHAADLWHPTAKGHAVIADQLLEFIVARSFER